MPDIRFSPSTLNYYDVDIGYSNLPSDLVKVKWNRYLQLLQEESTGRMRAVDSAGRPITVERKISLTEAKENKLYWINKERDRQINNGFTYNGKIYDADDTAKSNIIGMCSAITAGLPIGENFTWRTKDNQNIPLTAEQLIELGAALMIHINSIYHKSWALKAYVESLDDVAEVQAVDWNTL